MEKPVQSPPYDLIDIVVRAGAGAGKTTELTKRVLQLAENYHSKHQSYPHFVVTTFTRKATQELRERLLKQALDQNNPGLVQFVKRPSQLQISTIHGILSLFLSRHGSAMGLGPRLSIISESRERSLLKCWLRELCESSESFNFNFQTLIESSEFFEVLGAFQSYFRLKMQFGEPLFFCKKDFQKIRQTQSKELALQLQDFAGSIREETSNSNWLELAQHCETQAQQIQKSDEILGDWPSVRKNKETSEDLLAMRDYLKKKILGFSHWRATENYFQGHDDFCSLFASCGDAIAEKMKQAKFSSGEITMQDLETLSLWMIRQHPETAQAFSKSWDYWLIDEYQDTSPAQVELLKALAGASPSFVVGDPQQSIYLFRGARSEVFQNREDEARKTGVHHSMMTNYRSRPELLEFFNHLFLGLGKQFQAMLPKQADFSNRQDPVAEILIVKKDPDDAVSEELQAILFRCQELYNRGVPLEQICVLSRNNRDLEELAWMAKDLNLPVQVHSGGQFFERLEICDALCLLKFLCNPHDSKNLIQLLRSPAFKIEDQLLYEWSTEVSSAQSHWLTYSHNSHAVLTKLQNLLEQIHERGVGEVWRKTLIDEKYFQFAHFLDSSGRREANLWKLIQMIKNEERRPGFSYLDFLKNLDLKSLTTEDQDEGDAVPVVEPKKVHLMTVHASKGLQFAHVILAKMGKTAPTPSVQFLLSDETTGQWTLALTEPDEGKKVASLSGMALLERMKKRQQEEEDRVLYVALTRAESGVSLIYEEDPKDLSWAVRLPIQQAEGTHQEEKFSYRVRNQFFKTEKYARIPRPKLESFESFQLPQNLSLETISVTEMIESDSQKNISQAPREMADLHKALIGVDVHRLFETLQYKWMKNPQFRWQDMLPDLSLEHRQALTYLAEDQQGRWLQVIEKGEVEFGLTVKLGAHLIQGQVDLWGQDNQGQYWVVDYKTGSPQYQAKAIKQLCIYCWALQKMNKISQEESVKLVVIYPFSRLSIIETAPNFSEIENLVRSSIQN